MYPEKDFNHEAEAVANLTDHYRNKLVVPGFVQAFARQVNVLEGVFWDLIEKFYLANNPVGNQLDALGTIVGQSRLGLNDADYLAIIKLKIRANRAAGLAEDVIQLLALAGGTSPNYVEAFGPTYSGMFLVETWNLPSPLSILKMLRLCRSVGTYGELHYSTWPDGNDFEFVSRNATLTGEQGFGSRYSAAVGGVMVAAGAF